jgi:thiol-disulfide isomerase/thioredoxin
MRVRLILPALLVTALVALAACGSGRHGGAAAAKPAANQAADSTSKDSTSKDGTSKDGTSKDGTSKDGSAKGGAVTVPASLRFTATTLDGKAFDGASLAGHPVVLWFWAPWCATCAGEAATVSDLATEYKGKVDIVGVAGMGEEKEMHSFVSDLDVGGITHLSDNAGVVWKRFGVTQQSVYVLLDRNGKVVTRGWLDSQQFTAQVAKLATA